MIILAAGAKPTTKSNLWEDPRVSIGEDIPCMTTFFELKKMNKKKVRKFLKTFRPKRTRHYWKWVPGFLGLYKVSNKGWVKSVDRIIRYKDGRTRKYKGEIKYKGQERKGRPTVTLWKGNKQKCVPVCILVLEAFVGPRPKGKWALHKDDNAQNNQLDNLYWGTPSQNSQDAYRNGRYDHIDQGEKLRGENGTFSKLTTEQVNKIKKIWKKAKRNGTTFGLQTRLGKKFGVSRRNIGYIVNGKTRTTG